MGDPWVSAADLIRYQTYVDSQGHAQSTRMATVDQRWIISVRQGVQYEICFDKNFVKKHCFTEPKYKELLDASLPNGPLISGPWHGTTSTSEKKMEKLITHRVKQADYTAGRQASGKPTANPLQGVPSAKNTFINLSKVLKTTFEAAIVAAIQSGETPPWNVGEEKYLRIDFGAAAKGVICTAEVFRLCDACGAARKITQPLCLQTACASAAYHDGFRIVDTYQGVHLLTKKTSNDPHQPVFCISHMGTQGGHEPF